MKALLLTVALMVTAAAPASAADPKALIAEDQVTLTNIKSYLDAAFFDTSIDSDGDLIV